MKPHRVDGMVDVSDGKCVHKAKVLCEFMRLTRSLNLTDHLRHIANISCFTQMLTTQDHHIGNDSITDTDCLPIQDPVTVLLQCEGIPFLGIAQSNSIKLIRSARVLCQKT